MAQQTQSPILAIHGSASAGAQWHSLRQLCGEQRRVLSPDLPGYGAQKAQRCCNGSTLACRAQPLIELLRDETKPVHLVAHSFGAAIALQILRSEPELIRSLTFYEPVVPAIYKGSNVESDLTQLADLLSLSELLSATRAEVAMESFINFWHSPDAWRKGSATWRNKTAALAPSVLRDFREATSLPVGEYADLRFYGPVKFLCGAQTVPHARRMIRLLTPSLPNGDIVELPSMGHMGPVTHADRVNREILAHIALVEQFPLSAPIPGQMQPSATTL